MAKRILVVEDDTAFADVLTHNLTFEGFDVLKATDADRALAIAGKSAPDLVILDIGLPGMDGFELCRRWQGLRRRLPIIVLTAHGEKRNKLRGLSLGADDYLTKPIDLDEFLARVHAVLRRVVAPTSVLMLGRTTVDLQANIAWRGKRRIELTHRELELLRFLAERRPEPVSRDEIMQRVWGYADDTRSRAVDQAVVRLRYKVEPDPSAPRYIQTAYGDGYKLVCDVLSERQSSPSELD